MLLMGRLWGKIWLQNQICVLGLKKKERNKKATKNKGREEKRVKESAEKRPKGGISQSKFHLGRS